jgi:hypothetical protein
MTGRAEQLADQLAGLLMAHLGPAYKAAGAAAADRAEIAAIALPVFQGLEELTQELTQMQVALVQKKARKFAKELKRQQRMLEAIAMRPEDMPGPMWGARPR